MACAPTNEDVDVPDSVSVPKTALPSSKETVAEHDAENADDTEIKDTNDALADAGDESVPTLGTPAKVDVPETDKSADAVVSPLNVAAAVPDDAIALPPRPNDTEAVFADVSVDKPGSTGRVNWISSNFAS